MANNVMMQKDRPWRARLSFQNGEASAAIGVGNVVALLASNPAKVTKSGSAGSATLAQTLFAGIAANSAPAGGYLDVIIGGYAPAANLAVASRTASSVAWPSYAAGTAGDFLGIDSAKEALSYGGGSQAILLGSYPSATTQASSVGGTSLFLTIPVGVWVKGLF